MLAYLLVLVADIEALFAPAVANGEAFCFSVDDRDDLVIGGNCYKEQKTNLG